MFVKATDAWNCCFDGHGHVLLASCWPLLAGGGTPGRGREVRADALHHLPHFDRAREHPSHDLHLRAEARVEGNSEQLI